MPSIYNTSKSSLHPAVNVFIERCVKLKKTLNSREIYALNFLVKNLISSNLWDKFLTIYPFVGSSAETHTLNLKNPFRHIIKWYGTGLRHDRFGVTNTAFGYGNTFVAPGLLSDNNIHISVYNGTFWTSATKNAHTPLIGSKTVFDTFPGGGSASEQRRINTERIKTEAIHSIVLRTIDSDEYKRFKNALYVGNTFSQEYNDPSNHGFIFTYNCGSIRLNESRRCAGLSANDSLNTQAYGLIVGVNGIKCYVCGKIFGRVASLSEPVTIPLNKVYQDGVIGQIIDYTQYPFLIFSDRQFGTVPGSQQIGRANIRFASIGYAMNDEENKTFADIVQKFQELLLRNVQCVDVEISEAAFFDISAYPKLEILSLKKRIGIYEENRTDTFGCSLNILSVEVTGPIRVFESNEINPSVSIISFSEED